MGLFVPKTFAQYWIFKQAAIRTHAYSYCHNTQQYPYMESASLLAWTFFSVPRLGSFSITSIRSTWNKEEKQANFSVNQPGTFVYQEQTGETWTGRAPSPTQFGSKHTWAR